MVNSIIVNTFFDESDKVEAILKKDPIRVISPATIQRMKQILIKTINEGNGTIANTSGLEIREQERHIFPKMKNTSTATTSRLLA